MVEENGSIDAQAIRKTADAIEAAGGGRRRGNRADEEGGGLLVMAEAALAAAKSRKAGGRAGDARRTAAAALGIRGDGWTTLFAEVWPVEWFIESGAATMDELASKKRRGVQYLEGTPCLATATRTETVTILRWIAERGTAPGANGEPPLPCLAMGRGKPKP